MEIYHLIVSFVKIFELRSCVIFSVRNRYLLRYQAVAGLVLILLYKKMKKIENWQVMLYYILQDVQLIKKVSWLIALLLVSPFSFFSVNILFIYLLYLVLVHLVFWVLERSFYFFIQLKGSSCCKKEKKNFFCWSLVVLIMCAIQLASIWWIETLLCPKNLITAGVICRMG